MPLFFLSNCFKCPLGQRSTGVSCFGVIRERGRKGKYKEEKQPAKLKLVSQKPHLIREMTRLKYYAEIAAKLVS